MPASSSSEPSEPLSEIVPALIIVVTLSSSVIVFPLIEVSVAVKEANSKSPLIVASVPVSTMP